MGESSDSVSIDIDMLPLGGKVRHINFFSFFFFSSMQNSFFTSSLYSFAFLSLLTVCV